MVGRVLLPCDLSNFMGDVMNPLSPNQILRNLENGYFMTHQEQSEAAQYIRQLQQENLTLLGKRECDVHECRRKVREADDDSSLAGAIIYRK